MHICVRVQYRKRFTCQEWIEKQVLIFAMHDEETDVNKTNIDNFMCLVDFCPFCGYFMNSQTT